MTITTTLGAIVSAAPALRRLAAVPLAPRLAYHVAKLLGLLEADLRHYETARVALVRRLGVERPPTEAEIAAGAAAAVVDVPSAARVAFAEALAALWAVETSVAWGPVPFEALDGSTWTAADLVGLGPFLAAPTLAAVEALAAWPPPTLVD